MKTEFKNLLVGDRVLVGEFKNYLPQDGIIIEMTETHALVEFKHEYWEPIWIESVRILERLPKFPTPQKKGWWK